MLYALGTFGDKPLKRLWIYNPDGSGEVEKRFQALVGQDAEACFRYFPKTFAEAIPHISAEFPGRES